ncbi:hypothetical protein Cantr_07148 [Candida viswanathii]|uniref:Uncharacterized protein n=1 Tax=Candida viswanathii TaxID=5486 RepID=A0A367XZ24_9ASCO|nr:hypothetical protein Cantr_07148 [Candida viswanathii]
MCFNITTYIEHLQGLQDVAVVYPKTCFLIAQHKFMIKYKSGRSDITHDHLYNIESVGAILRDEENRWYQCDDQINPVAELHEEYIEFLGLSNLTPPTIAQLKDMKPEIDSR